LFHGLHFSSHSSLDLHVYSDADWQVILPTVVLQQVIIFSLAIYSSLGVARDSLLLPTLVLKLSTVPLLTPLLSYFDYDGSYMM
jgi:hypothetical protein